MLFQSQYDQKVDRFDNEKLIFLGTSKKPIDGERVLEVLGVRVDSGDIQTTVTYHYPLMPKIVKETSFSNTLSPAMFESFLNDLAAAISFKESDNKLIDLGVEHLSKPDITVLNEEQAWAMYMIFLGASGAENNARAGYSMVSEYAHLLMKGLMDPASIRNKLYNAMGVTEPE